MSVFPLPLLAVLQQQDTSGVHRFKEGVPSAPPPIPGGVAGPLRALFNAPLWLWVIGLLLTVVVAGLVVRALWIHRRGIKSWIVVQDRGVKLAIAGVLVLLLGTVAWGGTVSWNYMQHENPFCSGCHIMEGPWNKFAKDAGKHSKLKCHDCHQQSLYASSRQLVLWLADRPDKIPPHAPVRNERCEKCHATNEKEMWTRVKETAGHRTHLESDSAALAKVQCVTCHGFAVHAFIPAKASCGQSGCHDKLEFQLGKMADQTTLHCTQCHQFTAAVPRLATRDSAAGTLRPGNQECLACHEMQRMLADFDPVAEPHRGVCGTCHNPHKQKSPQEAAKTCATGQCHGNWGSIPFHVGVPHKRVVERCLTCHEHHAAKVDASDCVGCHTKVSRRFGSLHPPLPFDTSRALRPSENEASPPGEPEPASWGIREDEDGDYWDAEELARPEPAEIGKEVPPAPPDSFPHGRHRKLACITCHASGVRHGLLTFERPRGCQICHHQRPQQADCSTCHRAEDRRQPIALTIAIGVRDSSPRSRPVSFAHSIHTKLRCQQCHTEPVTLAPAAQARACRDCHGDHHTAQRTCATCHTGPQLRAAHRKDPSATHRACDVCHTATTIALLTPDRSFCLTCHARQQAHYVQGQCSVCHFLKRPDELRPQLLARRRG